MNTTLKELINISHRAGKSVELIQGGGGNTSIKDGFLMYIKASGTVLKKMSKKKGYSVIDLRTKKLMKGEKPSMEWLMHAYLPRCVIHTHAIYLNVFTSLYGGKKFLLDFFETLKPIYIPYVCPGKKLAQAIKKIANKKTQLIFLENHGLITCGNNMQEVLRMNFFVNNKLKKYLASKIDNFIPFSQIDITKAKKNKRCIFPDAAVFLKTKKVNRSHKEIFAANDYIIRIIKKLNKQHHNLTPKQIKKLQNLDEEKYRMTKN